MDGLVDLLKDTFGFTLPVILLWPAISIIKAVVNGIEGAGDIVNKVGNSQFGSKRLQAEADALKNKKQAAAYNNIPTTRTGKVLDFVTGKSSIRSRRRRELRYQDAETGAKAGEAGFGVADPKAAALMQSIAKSNAQMSAVNAANNAKFVSGVATGATSVGSGLGAASDEEVQKAIGAQQARAVADAIRDVELNASFAPGDLAAIGSAMEKAIKDGDSISARAYQNMLLTSGSSGTKQFRETMNGILPGQMAGSTEADLKRNILNNHANVKDTAADIGEYATSGAGTPMQTVSGDAETWKMSDEKLVSQKSHSLLLAEAASGIDKAQAVRIKNDQRLYSKLDAKGQAIIDRLAI